MESISYIINLFVTGGLVMYPLLVLSMITVAIGIERWYFFRLNTKGGRGFAHGVYHSAPVTGVKLTNCVSNFRCLSVA